MKILIKNVNLISMSEKREKYEENIDILIENKKISKIDKNIDCNVDKIIDGSGKILMPGLINAHSHVPMSIFKETIDGYDLQSWLNKKIWPMESKLNEEDIYYASLLSYIEMIKSGTTMVNDMYFKTDNIIKAAKDIGIRLQTTWNLLANNMQEGLDNLSNIMSKYKNEDLINFNAGIHGLYTNTPSSVEKYLEYSKEKNINIHMHFCENSKEIDDIKDIYGMRPIDIIKKYFNDRKCLFAHCVKLNKEDIKMLSKYDISVVHCPISNLKLGCGIADVNTMLENNINVSLGTDGQGSGSNLDLFDVMKITPLLQKGINENPKLIDSYSVLQMATINGAKALSMENKIGKIEDGYLADMIILDVNNTKMQPINNIFSDIVYNANGSNVITTIINGNIVMEDRKLNIDLNYIYDKCKNIIDRIKLS